MCNGLIYHIIGSSWSIKDRKVRLKCLTQQITGNMFEKPQNSMYFRMLIFYAYQSA